MRYDSVEDMPPALRRLYEQQIARKQGQVTGEHKNSPVTKITALAEAPNKPKRKYNNHPTERLSPTGEIIKFRSKTEACYYDKLVLMEKAGQVRKIRLEVEFLLKPSYTDGQTGEHIRDIKYYADFVYEKLTPSGAWREVIVDTKGGGKKGTETKTFALKRKLMADMGYHIEAINKGEF